MELFCFNWAEYITAITAIVTVCVTWKQYSLHKDRERSKVFSKLNEQYLKDENVQYVVKYLSKTGPEITKPDDYQTELFLRFFEEIGVYLKSGSIEPKPVEQLFGYYLYEIFTSDKGKELLEVCSYKGSEWEYLEEFKEMMCDVNHKWSTTLNKNFSIWS